MRTHARDGGGAYLLLDGSRCMKGNFLPCSSVVQRIGTATVPWFSAHITTLNFTTLLAKVNNAVFAARAIDNAKVDFIARDNDTDVQTICATLQASSEPSFGFNRMGNVTFVNGGLPFACISVIANGTATTINTINVKEQFTHFDTDSAENNADADQANDHVKITKAGNYFVICSIHAESVAAGGADTFSFDIYKNNGAALVDPIHGHRQLAGGGGDVGSISISGIAALSVDDTLELWVTNNSSTDNILIADVSLTVIEIGS